MNYFPDQDDATEFRVEISARVPGPRDMQDKTCLCQLLVMPLWTTILAALTGSASVLTTSAEHPDNFRFANDQAEQVS